MMYHSIRTGQTWLDTDGNRIQAHGGSILAVGDTFCSRRMPCTGTGNIISISV